MAKGSTGRKSNKKTPQKSLSTLSDSDMDDEIDVFHKQRDVVPLDLDDDTAESDEDNDQHIFEIEGGSSDEDEEDDDDEDEDTGLAAKIAKQQKSLKAKIGGAKDETQDEDEDNESKSVAWGKGKNIYYDNDDKGESSEDEEEAEVLKLQNEKMKLYSNADHGLEDDDDEDDEEPTFEENLRKGKVSSKPKVKDDTDTDYEIVKKDPSALSQEEQMDIVYNSAPELVGLLSELKEAVEQLETKVDPVLIKLKEEKNVNTPGIQYMELKKQLLLSYCQAITFHLLLKSEGHSVHDHPVLARLVEIKNLLDKMKPLDENLSFEIEDFLKKHVTTTMEDSPKIAAVNPVSIIGDHKNTVESSETQKESIKMDATIDKVNEGKRKRQNEQIGLQSVEMLKVRAALEEKLKQNGVFNLKAPNPNRVNKNQKPLNGKLEARDDFDDDTFDIEGNQKKSSKVSQLIRKKAKVISGDDDLPKRDDIGERRRKHEIRVLAGAGIQSDDDDIQNDETTLEVDDTNKDGETDSDSESDSEPDLYEETKIKREAKLAAKAQKYSRATPSVAMPETLVDGKRHINYEMEKNRGLTRKRNKDIKNPRKKYKLKHKKKEVARKGQVREHKKPAGPYGGEGSGINTISRSIRFKS